jgi:oxygen-dependent protoporphyrinogen oxidase
VLRLKKSPLQIYLNAEDGKGEGVPLRATHLISALPLPVLDSILQQPPAGGAEAAAGASTTHPSLPHLRTNPHSSVTVLNLVFPTSPPNKNDNSTGEQPTPASTPLHPPGFGYLIPRPEHGYPEPGREGEHEHEHEGEPGLGLLGVVFDTASLPEQDHDGENDAAGFTKMTAMLGGPYPCPNARDSSSSDAQLVAAVVRRISSQLGHALPPPVHYAVHRNAESIPTYLVGHTARMGQLGRALRERWSGRMKVVGAGVGGVSVADCVKAGRQAAFEVAAQMGN